MTKRRDYDGSSLVIRYSFELRHSDLVILLVSEFDIRISNFPVEITLRSTSRRVYRAGRLRNRFQARYAQFLAPGLQESDVHPLRARSHRCAAARGGLTPRSSKAHNARRAPCLPPSLRHCPIRRTLYRGHTRCVLLLLLPDE